MTEPAWHLIANPESGSFPGQDALSALKVAGQPVVLRLTERPAHAMELAVASAREGALGIAACGGDGTLSEVVNGLMQEGLDCPLVLLPSGTGNDLARTLGLPLDPVTAAEASEVWTLQPIDVLEVRGADGAVRYGINAAVGGEPVAVNEDLDAEVKKRFGALAFVGANASVLVAPPTFEIRLELDDGTVETAQSVGVVVCNGRSAGGGMTAAPHADPADGVLEVSLCRAGALADYAALGARLLAGEVLDDPLVLHHLAREVRIASDPPMPFNLDGELIGTTPITIRVVPGALRLLRPQGLAE